MSISKPLCASIMVAFIAAPGEAQTPAAAYVQVAELEIDPEQLDRYKSAVSEHAETAIRVEPGVLVLYAVSDKDEPARVRVFELYKDDAAYRAHLESAHFKKYKEMTEKMVLSLKLIRSDPIMLASKQR